MATTYKEESMFGEQLVCTWTLGNADEGAAKRIGKFADLSYGMWGTWSSATVIIQGSWDNPNGTPASGSWMTLTESDNTTAISNNANAAGAILEVPVWIRPKSTGGSGTAVNVVISAPWRK